MNRALVVASVIVTAMAAVAAAPLPARAGVNVDINIGVPFLPPPPPPPQIVVAAPPRLVVVPGSPVYYAPALPVDVFVYGGQYYRHHHDAWFSAPGYRGPWRHLAYDRVPRHVMAVPAHYYKIPPGHLRKMEQGRGGRWNGGREGHGGRHEWRGRDRD
jgi:hypothetical protein